MGIRDRHFYPTLFMQLFFLVVCLRLLAMAVGIKLYVPYLDTTIYTIFGIAGSIAGTIAQVTGGWW